MKLHEEYPARHVNLVYNERPFPAQLDAFDELGRRHHFVVRVAADLSRGGIDVAVWFLPKEPPEDGAPMLADGEKVWVQIGGGDPFFGVARVWTPPPPPIAPEMPTWPVNRPRDTDDAQRVITPESGRLMAREPKSNLITPGPAKVKPSYAVIGDTGLNRAGGLVFEEYLPDLRGERGHRVLREMIEGDAIIGGILFAIEMMIRRIEWRLDPASDDPVAHQWAERVDQARDDMEISWVDLMAEAVSFIPWGFSIMEVLWKRCEGDDATDPTKQSRFDDGVITWRNFAVRAQDTLLRWEMEPDGTPTAMVQLVPYTGKYAVIPLAKCLHFKTVQRKNSPEGKPAIRNCYNSWYLKKRIQMLEAIGIERNWVGLPVARIPGELLSPAANSNQLLMRNAVQNIVTNIRNDEQGGVLWPGDRDELGNREYELEFLHTGGAATLDTDRVIQRHNHDIARALQAGFIFLSDGQGSYALSVSQTGFFARALAAWVKHMCEVINRSAIAPMMRFNAVPQEHWPTLNHSDIGEIDMEAMANNLLALGQAGLIDVADPDLRAWVAQTFGLPIAEQSPEQEDEAEPKANIQGRGVSSLDPATVFKIMPVKEDAAVPAGVKAPTAAPALPAGAPSSIPKLAPKTAPKTAVKAGEAHDPALALLERAAPKYLGLITAERKAA